jgi:hypothetical protein
MQDSSALLRLGGRRLAAVVAAGAIAVTLFAGAWAQDHKLNGSALIGGRKLSVVKVDSGRKLSMMTTKARKL